VGNAEPAARYVAFSMIAMIGKELGLEFPRESLAVLEELASLSQAGIRVVPAAHATRRRNILVLQTRALETRGMRR